MLGMVDFHISNCTQVSASSSGVLLLRSSTKEVIPKTMSSNGCSTKAHMTNASSSKASGTETVCSRALYGLV